MLTILFDGIAYGMLLFILAVGLAVTMGLMNFINLAHGAFAMVGGYITVLLMQKFDVPFLLCLPLAFLGSALLGAVLERTLYRPLYHRPHLDQVLFSIGLTFMAVASADYFIGSGQQIIQLPEWLKGRTELGQGAWMLGMGHYRLFIIAVCAALTVALQYVLAKTRFGSRLRASVDDQRVAAGMVRTFQINQLFDTLTPLETLAMVVSQQQGLGNKWWQALGSQRRVTERCEQLLEQFHLTTMMAQETRVLAYGKRRLLEIAIALACEPRVLLLDEPVAGVPAGEREELLQTVAALPADVSILLIEHDMDLVFSFAKRMTVLVNGTVLTEGSPDQIANDPQVKAVYLGHGDEINDAMGGMTATAGGTRHE